MSYNCSVTIKSDPETLAIFEKGLSSLKEAQIEISCGELEADFREDCSGIVDDIGSSKSLSFELSFYDEDDVEHYSKYFNGTPVIVEVR